MSARAWVVGRGLLGSCVERVIAGSAWRPEAPLVWSDPTRLGASLEAAVQGFASRLASEAPSSWSVYWCAGVGVVGTPAADLGAETAAFRRFLERLGAALDRAPRARDIPGRVFLASSAGGVWGGSTVRPVNERTPPRPISDYGRAKLEQEETLAAWACRRPAVSTLVCRLTNLYGQGQRLDKPQGLISHMSRCLIYGAPVHVYVPLDTIRDYLFAEDAARGVVAGMERLERESPAGGLHVTKAYGSERATSVAELIGAFRRIARRQLRVVSGVHPMRAQQPARVQVRSEVWIDGPGMPHTHLIEGVRRVHRHQLALHQAGVLSPPASVR